MTRTAAKPGRSWANCAPPYVTRVLQWCIDHCAPREHLPNIMKILLILSRQLEVLRALEQVFIKDFYVLCLVHLSLNPD